MGKTQKMRVKRVAPYVTYAVHMNDPTNPFPTPDKCYATFNKEYFLAKRSYDYFNDIVQDMGGDEGWSKRVYSKPPKPTFKGEIVFMAKSWETYPLVGKH